jgi:hypothetical protein
MPELTLQALYQDNSNIDKINRRRLQIILDTLCQNVKIYKTRR